MSTVSDNRHTHREAAELAHRVGGGIEVLLLWGRDDDRLQVIVRRLDTGRAFSIAAKDGPQALDAFYHPFAYAAAQGIDFATADERRPAAAAVPARPPGYFAGRERA